jgi:hypothetical protein
MRDRCRRLGGGGPAEIAVRWNRRRVGSCGEGRPVIALAAFSLAAAFRGDPQRQSNAFWPSGSSFGDPRHAHAFIDALALRKISRIVGRRAGADARNGEGRD